jgi:hypothetical protein
MCAQHIQKGIDFIMAYGSGERGDIGSPDKNSPNGETFGGARENGRNAADSEGGGETKGGGGLKFILCALVLAGVMLTLPYTRDAARDIARRIAIDVDVESAIQALGEGISGERGFLQAIGDAVAVAFNGSGSDGSAGGGDISVSAASPESADGQAPPEGDGAIPDSAALFEDAVTASFGRTRSEYSDMLIPAGAPRG